MACKNQKINQTECIFNTMKVDTLASVWSDANGANGINSESTLPGLTNFCNLSSLTK